MPKPKFFPLWLAAAALGLSLGAWGQPRTPRKGTSAAPARPKDALLVSRAMESCCRGVPLSQKSSDATQQFADEAAGIRVTQITSNGKNWISYFDIPVVSSIGGGLLVYRHEAPRMAVVSNLDGSDSEILYDKMDGDVFLSWDGRVVYGTRPSSGPRTQDLYATDLSEHGRCKVRQVSHLEMAPQRIPNAQVSTSAVDPKSGKNVIAFADAVVIHRVLEDGTKLPDVSLPDTQGYANLHRLRMDPKFPNILFYKRNLPGRALGEKPMWLIDLNNPQKAYSVDEAFGANSRVSHPRWMRNGTEIGYQGNNTGRWYIATVLDSEGRILPTPFKNVLIGPQPETRMTANYCDLSPDGSAYVCTTNGNRENAGDLFLMSANGRKVKILLNIPTRPRQDAGVPVAQWLDSAHIIFRSDVTGTPELYVVTGFGSLE